MSTPPDPVRTAYCISPYKTGTTFLSGLFNSRCRVEHEPLHYGTLKRLDNVEYLSRRAAYLNLDLECSGFFAGELSRLRQFAPEAPVVYLQRPPEVWVSSVISYFSGLSSKIRYNYVCRLYFDRYITPPLDRFEQYSEEDKAKVVEALLQYWVRVYQEASMDKRTLVVPLDRITDHLSDMEDFVGLPVDRGAQPWKRTNISRPDLRLEDYVNMAPHREKLDSLTV
ncbi:hypothetical protein [Halospina denitrificans]|nr:hypothetical protein [Halospina denitrificans]